MPRKPAQSKIAATAAPATRAAPGEIVVYQPDETLRLDVRVENETVWLTQEQMCSLFDRDQSVIARHIRNAFGEGEVDAANNMQILHNNRRGQPLRVYSLDVIISVGYRVKSQQGVRFRRWATQVLKDYLLRGYAVNDRLVQIEDRIDRRFARQERDIVDLKEKVDFFVQTRTPPVRGVFFAGQLWDARSLVEGLVARAKTSILLIDSWVGPGTLDILAKKRTGVAARIVTSQKGNKIAATDIATFNAQYPSLSVQVSKSFHDRFLVLDDKELYLVGASLKDLGAKCFAFSKMDASAIPDIKSRI